MPIAMIPARVAPATSHGGLSLGPAVGAASVDGMVVASGFTTSGTSLARAISVRRSTLLNVTGVIGSLTIEYMG